MIKTIIQQDHKESSFFLPLEGGQTNRIKKPSQKVGKKVEGVFAAIVSHPTNNPSYDWFTLEEIHFALKDKKYKAVVYVKGVGQIWDVFQLFQLASKQKKAVAKTA